MELMTARVGKPCKILFVRTGDTALEHFLLTLGCVPGAQITVISRQAGGCVIALGDSRYHIEKRLAEAIVVEQGI